MQLRFPSVFLIALVSVALMPLSASASPSDIEATSPIYDTNPGSQIVIDSDIQTGCFGEEILKPEAKIECKNTSLLTRVVGK